MEDKWDTPDYIIAKIIKGRKSGIISDGFRTTELMEVLTEEELKQVVYSDLLFLD